MITARIMTGAFLFHDEDVLMLKRSENKKIAPGLWACVGGHVEPEEMTDPRSSCLREIAEETGVTEEQIEGLELRYILLRQKGMEINQHYIFLGKSKTRRLGECDEGELHWIPFSEMVRLEMPLSLRLMIRHYVNHRENTGIWTGIYSPQVDKEEMIWGQL